MSTQDLVLGAVLAGYAALVVARFASIRRASVTRSRFQWVILTILLVHWVALMGIVGRAFQQDLVAGLLTSPIAIIWIVVVNGC